jgi:hypothetical protein
MSKSEMKSVRFVSFAEAAERLHGKTVAIVGSAPSVLGNEPKFVDGHDVVVRVNNYKTGPAQGSRCDVFYSFFGSSIRKSAQELQRDGVTLCMCKCPDDKPIRSAWHEANGKQNGIDFRYIYRDRASWWFCDTFVPDSERFLRSFELLGGHVPTTGFAAILDVLDCAPASVTLTGFDFFDSGKHNVNERWKPGDPNDPIGHRPELEKAWLAANADLHPIVFDRALKYQMRELRERMAQQ